VLCCVLRDAEDGRRFARFVEDFEKGYTMGSKERAYRYRVFRRNLRFFDAFNAERSEETGITQGVTPFADLTEAEWEARFHGMVPPDQGVVDALSVPFVPDPAFVAPVAVDWRTPTAALPAGAVAPIKNQGNCSPRWWSQCHTAGNILYGKSPMKSSRIIHVYRWTH
jgi:hypothetical protein